MSAQGVVEPITFISLQDWPTFKTGLSLMYAVSRSTTRPSLEGDFCAICRVCFHGRYVAPAIAKTRCGHRVDMSCISVLINQTQSLPKTCNLCQKNPFPIIPEDLPCDESQPLQARRSVDNNRSGFLSRVFRYVVNFVNPYIEIESLFHAAECGDIDFLRALIDAGVNPNAICSSGATPLHLAAERGHPCCVQALADAGASLNADHSGFTPLFLATQNGHTCCVQTLIAAGADLNAVRTTDLASPLYIAAHDGHTGCLKALIAGGANIHGGCLVFTPLFIATQNGHSECVQALIDAGAKRGLIESFCHIL